MDWMGQDRKGWEGIGQEWIGEVGGIGVERSGWERIGMERKGLARPGLDWQGRCGAKDKEIKTKKENQNEKGISEI
jgi:hypothetical protein